MTESKERWSKKKKAKIVLELLRGGTLDELSRRYQVTASQLSQWRDRFIESGMAGFQNKTADDIRVAQLEKKVGQQTMMIELLKKKREWMQSKGMNLSD